MPLAVTPLGKGCAAKNAAVVTVSAPRPLKRCVTVRHTQTQLSTTRTDTPSFLPSFLPSYLPTFLPSSTSGTTAQYGTYTHGDTRVTALVAQLSLFKRVCTAHVAPPSSVPRRRAYLRYGSMHSHAHSVSSLQGRVDVQFTRVLASLPTQLEQSLRGAELDVHVNLTSSSLWTT